MQVFHQIKLDGGKMQKFNQNEIVCFTMPKIREQEADNQDAYFCSKDGSMVAIADGASTSLFPKEWANLLVEDFCNQHGESIENLCQQWQEWLKPLQNNWRNDLINIKQDPNIPWYVKGSQNKNLASATFVGLKLHPPNQKGKKTWEAIAIGDSCLFQLQAVSKQIIVFPIRKSSDFRTITESFNSLPEYNRFEPKYQEGDYEDGDIFLLATDALAEWVLRDIETKKREGKNLISVATQKEFEEFIQGLRDNKVIKNDDTTLCRIKVVGADGKLGSGSHSGSRKLVVSLIGLGLLGGFVILIILFGYLLNQNYQKTENNQQNNAENNEGVPHWNIPIYLPDKPNSPPIGYLWKKPPNESENDLELWLYTPKSYLETSKLVVTIPPEEYLPLFYTGETANIDENDENFADFLGYLLPGEYLVLEPKKSVLFKENRWVKVKVKVKVKLSN